jgi:hypothetical protein
MTSDHWYEVIQPTESLTQGDIILRCPLLTWDTQGLTSIAADDTAALAGLARAFRADVVVMTQACDLENGKVTNVVLCPHLPLSAYRVLWEDKMRQVGQNPTEKSWKRLCDDVANGYVWNQAMLNRSDSDGAASETRLVDFHEVFTLPRSFLEAILLARKEPRLRLRPPYREHLSQAFARFFMRVGLPTPITKAW